MSNRTNWKNLGRQQGGNMKNNRNMKVDKMHFINGNWDTIYTTDNLKRLAYYNIDVPSIVGIGTNRPFSKLSFGDSTDQGHHVTGSITPGKVTAIALHEKLTNIDDVLKEGQEFTGLSYVTNLRSIRKLQDNTEAKGLAFYSNKTSETEDTSMKTDKGVMYITDDNYIHIGGKPKGYNLIDTRGVNRKIPSATQKTGPAILLDVSGSIHVNGFINFLKNGNETVNYLTDNPANQMTYKDGEIQYIDPDSITPADQDTALNLGAVPEGAIWVGFEKPLTADTSTTALAATPRLYLMRAGKATRVLIEGDAAAGSDGGTTGGLTFDGSTDSDNSNLTPFYVFRNTSQVPGNVLMNTYVGYPTNSNNIPSFGVDNPLPALLNTTRNFATNPEAPCVVSIMGGLAVFDSTKGGSNADYLDYSATNSKLDGNKVILESDIYTRTETGKKPQTELGVIYTDRHLMIGGCSSYNGNSDAQHPQPFKTMSSAIDVSGGIINKPLIRSITGKNRGGTSNDDSSLVARGVNAQDSIIVGNTPPAHFNGYCKESIVVGTHNQTEAGTTFSIIDNVNTLVMGEDCQSKYISNSLVVGFQCKSGPTSQPASGGNENGVVSLGYKAQANATTNADVRFAFGTYDSGSGGEGNVFTIDKKGSVVIQAPGGTPPSGSNDYGNLTVKGNLTVEGNHTELEVQEVIAKDKCLSINAKDDNGTTKGASSDPTGGGIQLFTTQDNQTKHVALIYDDDSSRSRWTTCHGSGSQSVGIACGGNAGTSSGEEEFVVSKDGGLKMLRESSTGNYLVKITQSNTSANKGNMIFYEGGNATLTFKRADGDIDLSGNIQIDPEANFGEASGPTTGTTKNALTIGGGFSSTAGTTAEDIESEGFELQHEYTNNKAVVNMKISGDSAFGGGGEEGTTSNPALVYINSKNFTTSSDPIIDIDAGKRKYLKSAGLPNPPNKVMRIYGNYDNTSSTSTNTSTGGIYSQIQKGAEFLIKGYQNTSAAPQMEKLVGLYLSGELVVKGPSEEMITNTRPVMKIAQFHEDYDPANNKYGIVIDISKNTAGDTKANLKIAGKLTVAGLIDPTGLVLDNQSSFPNGGANSNKVTIWSHSGTLKFTTGSSTAQEFATKASVDAITSGGSGGTNVGSANKIKVQPKSNNVNYNLVFTDTNGATGDANADIYYDSEGTSAGLRYNPSSNTLSADKFDGKATKLKVSGSPGRGYVMVDINGDISANSIENATQNTDGLMSSSDKTKLNAYPNVLSSGGSVSKFLNQTGNFAQIVYSDITGTNNFLTNDSDLEFDNGENREIRIKHRTGDEGHGNDLTIRGSNAAHTSVNHNGGKIVIKGGDGDNAGNGGNIELTPGDGGSDSGSTAGNIVIGGKITTDIGDLEIAPADNIKLNTTGSVTLGKADNNTGVSLKIENSTTTGNGGNLTITAQSAASGGTNLTGGHVILSGGVGSTIGGTKGSVKIDGTLKSLSGNLTLGENIDFETVDANRTITAPDHTSTASAGDGNDIIIKGGNEKGSSNFYSGNVVIDFGNGSGSTTGRSGALVIKKSSNNECNLRSQGSGAFNITSGYDQTQATGIISTSAVNINIKPANAGVVAIGGTDPTIQSIPNNNLTIKSQDREASPPGSGEPGYKLELKAGNYTGGGGYPNKKGGEVEITSGNTKGLQGVGGDIKLTSGNRLNNTDDVQANTKGNIICDATSITAPNGSSSAGDSLTIKGGDGHSASQNGGDLILKGGNKTSGGSDGKVNITSNMELGAGTELDYTIQHKTLTNDGSGNKLTITGQNAKGNNVTDSHGFSAGNIEIKAGSGSNADIGASTSANGGDGGNIILTPGDGGDNENSGTDGNNGYVEINSTENSTSTTSGALQVKGGVGIANNLNVGGAVGITGTLTAGTIVTTQVNVPLDIVTTSTPSPVASKIYAVTIDNSTTTTTMTLPNIGAVGDTIKFVFRCDATSNNVIFAAANSTSFDNTKSYIVISSDGIAANPTNGSAIYAPATNNNTITIGSASTGTFGTLTFIASTSAKWSVVGDIQCTGNVTSTTIFSTTT